MYDELVKRLREHNGWALNETLDEAADAIEELMRRCEQFQYMPPPAWIPVTERLPKIDMSYPHHEDYLVQYDSGNMDVASWSNVNRFWTDHVTEPHWNCVQFAEVIAWMPLPEPPKNEQMDLIGDGKRCEEVCKHAPPEKWKWPCDDCDMRFHDRAEPPKEEDDE